MYVKISVYTFCFNNMTSYTYKHGTIRRPSFLNNGLHESNLFAFSKHRIAFSWILNTLSRFCLEEPPQTKIAYLICRRISSCQAVKSNFLSSCRSKIPLMRLYCISFQYRCSMIIVDPIKLLRRLHSLPGVIVYHSEKRL